MFFSEKKRSLGYLIHDYLNGKYEIKPTHWIHHLRICILQENKQNNCLLQGNKQKNINVKKTHRNRTKIRTARSRL